jgi:hypothetical protein
MPKALANRLCHFEIIGDFGSWKDWAVKNRISPMVAGFLTFKPDYLMKFDATDDNLAFATPRSWEMVSNILSHVSGDINKVYPLIAGCIGIGAAVEFRTWCAIYNDLPNIEDIFDGKSTYVPKSSDVIYATISRIVSYAARIKDDMQRIANSVRYGLNLPPDFASVLFRDYLSLESGYQLKLMSIPEFTAWLSKNRRFIDNA